MESKIFDVSLYWHTGGCLFLGTVAALGIEQAKDSALSKYMNASKKQRREIEEGGNFSLEADLISASEASRFLAVNS